MKNISLKQYKSTMLEKLAKQRLNSTYHTPKSIRAFISCFIPRVNDIGPIYDCCCLVGDGDYKSDFLTELKEVF